MPFPYIVLYMYIYSGGVSAICNHGYNLHMQSFLLIDREEPPAHDPYPPQEGMQSLELFPEWRETRQRLQG